MSDCVVALVTVGSEEQGQQIANALVTEQLAACVNIVGPITSTYRWEGKVEHERELLLMIKTRAALFPAVEARVKALHSYALPEVIALPVSAGSEPYLEWLRGATRPPRT